MKLKSKDYRLLVERLGAEIVRNKELIKQSEENGDVITVGIARDYISYHEEIIKLICKLDKEVEK